MKVAQLTKYNKKNPQILISNASLPPLGPYDLLIQVKAAGVNPLDNLIAWGDLKLVVPYKLPQTLGNEFVGLVQQTGKDVTNFKVGDRVYGRNPLNNIGAFAEELVVNQSAVAHVPEYLTNQEAAGVPLTALTAIQALELLQAKPGQTLFISGGTGSFGAMAIPIAVAKGLKVITSGSPQNQQRVEQLGVNKFIDYTKEDYRKSSAFFIGNEGNGLSDGLTRAADRKIKIPMSGNVESLNAAMAAGLLMYEARRQREEGGD